MSQDIYPSNDANEVAGHGFVSRWLICGPFISENADRLSTLRHMGRLEVPEGDPLGGELDIKPSRGMTHHSDSVPSGQVSWSYKEVGSTSLIFDSEFEGKDHGLVYAAAYIDSEDDRLLICDFRADMAGALIVNGQMVSPSSALVPIRLVKCSNLIMVKVVGAVQRRTNWGAKLSFSPAFLTDRGDLALTRPRFTGFYRGTAENPQIEIEYALANLTSSDLTGSSTEILVEGEPVAEYSAGILKAGETRLVRQGVPVNREEGGNLDLALKLMDEIEVESRAEGIDPPSKNERIFVGAGFHCDPVWTHTQSMYNDISLSNVSQYLQFCRSDPDFKVIFHELDYLKPYLDFYPNDRDYLINLAQAERVIPGGSYCQPNEKNVSGEQIIRNILYGRLFARSQFGVIPTTYHAWDVFGHIPQLSQILSKSGNQGVVWSKSVKGFPPVFRYISLDGTDLLHRRVDYSFTTGSFDEMRQRAYTRFEEMRSLGHEVDLRMDSTDFKPPTAWSLGRCSELKSLLPSIEIANPTEFFHQIQKSPSASDIPYTSRDATQYHIGTSQSRIELKIANRLGEMSAYNGELLSTLSSLLGNQYPDLRIDKVWRQLLFNSHHDAITGTSCDISYLDMMQGYREALDLSGEVNDSALESICQKVDTRDIDGIPVLVFNTLNWNRTDVARVDLNFDQPVKSFELLDSEGVGIPFCILDKKEEEGGIISARIEFTARDVPSVGFETYIVKPVEDIDLPCWVQREQCFTIENDFYIVEVDPQRGGGICSIKDKDAEKEIVRKENQLLMNEIAVLKEEHDRHEPSWEFFTTGERMFSGDFPADISVQASGPTRKMEIRNSLREGVDLVREIKLRDGVKRIDLTTKIMGYEGEDDLFCAVFPPDIEGGSPTYEERFGSITKHKGRRKFDYRTWRGDAYSDCSVHSSQNFFDYGSTTKIRFVDNDVNTVAAMNLGSVGIIFPHDEQVRPLAIDIQRELTRRGVLTTPWFDDNDSPRRGELSSTDSTQANERDGDLANCNFRISIGIGGDNSYSNSLLGHLQDSVKEGFLGRVERLGFDFLVVPDSDLPDGWEPMPVLVIMGRDEKGLKYAVDFLIEGLRTGDIIIPRHANRLSDCQVEDYGLSVLNNGNMANTVEPDGTMTLFLKHTAEWSRKHLDEKFVPERKDHIFHYALYPHAGNWREAKSYRKGWEFNSPMICRATGKHDGSLDTNHSFLSISGDSLVMTAMKPLGNPVASFKSGVSDASEGLVIRVYEAEGRPIKSHFRASFPLKSVQKADLMENPESEMEVEDQGSFSTEIGPFSIQTFALYPDLEPNQDNAIEPKPMEIVQPVYSKYWEQNLGPAPIGYQPVTVSIQGTPVTEAGGRGTTVNSLSVSIMNNYVDRDVSGKAVLEAPEGWTLEPGEISYQVPSRSCKTYDFAFSFSGNRRTGLLRVRLKHGGQEYEDVMEIGEKSKIRYGGGGAVYQDVLHEQVEKSIKWQTYLRKDGLSVKLENPYNERVSGGIALITPLETWSESEVGDYSMVKMSPSVNSFELPPKGRQVLDFEFEEEDPHFWIYAKLFYMGRTEYKRVK